MKSRRSKHIGRSLRKGFSLLEVLIAVALGAALLVAGNYFVLSMGELWGTGTDVRLFDQHVRGVTRFTESLTYAAVPRSFEKDSKPSSVREAAPDDARGREKVGESDNGGNPTGSSPQQEQPTIIFTLENPAGYEALGIPLLTFELNAAPGICVWEGEPLPAVVCSLQATPEEGLTLLWKSRLEDDYGKGRPRKTLISPFVKSISYVYRDPESAQLTSTDAPGKNDLDQYVVPERITFVFERGSERREVSITLPPELGGPPKW